MIGGDHNFSWVHTVKWIWELHDECGNDIAWISNWYGDDALSVWCSGGYLTDVKTAVENGILVVSGACSSREDAISLIERRLGLSEGEIVPWQS